MDHVKLHKLPQSVKALKVTDGIEPGFKIAGVDQIILLRRIDQKILHLFRGPRRDPLGLFRHFLRLGEQINHGAVLKEVAPVRPDGADRNVVGHAFSGALKEPREEMRQGQNGRAHVKGVALRLQQIELAADPAVLFIEVDLVALLPQ